MKSDKKLFIELLRGELWREQQKHRFTKEGHARVVGINLSQCKRILELTGEIESLNDAVLELGREHTGAKQKQSEKFEELVEKFHCNLVKRIVELDDVIFEIGDECYSLKADHADLQADMAMEFAELKKEGFEIFEKQKEAISTAYENATIDQKQLSALKVVIIQKDNKIDDLLIKTAKQQEKINELETVIRKRHEDIIKMNTPGIRGIPFPDKDTTKEEAPILYEEEPNTGEWDQEKYGAIVELFLEEKYTIKAKGNGIVAKRQGRSLIECIKNSKAGEPVFIIKKQRCTNFDTALKISMGGVEI